MDSLTIWILIVGLAIPIYAARASFIFLFSNFESPDLVARALRFVPVAVFVSLIVPEMLFVSGEIQVSLLNPKLVAGVVAGVIAWHTRSTLLTLVIGMAVFQAVRWIGHS